PGTSPDWEGRSHPASEGYPRCADIPAAEHDEISPSNSAPLPGPGRSGVTTTEPFLSHLLGARPRHEVRRLRQLQRRILTGELDLLPVEQKGAIVERLAKLLGHRNPSVRLRACECILAASQRQVKLCWLLLDEIKKSTCAPAGAGDSAWKPERDLEQDHRPRQPVAA